MNEKDNQQQLNQFFQQFKKLKTSIPLEKVHQIINDPTAKARYKVKFFKPLNLIIMTFLISISVLLTLLFSIPEAKQINTTEPNPLPIKNEVIITGDRTESSDSVTELAEKATVEFIEEEVGVAQTERIVAKITESTVEKIQENSTLSDTLIDGSKFILELSNEELERLGFKINHYTIYYRNSYNNRNVFYLSTHSNGRFSVRGDNVFYNMKDYYPLQADTIAESCSMKYMKLTQIGMGHTREDRKREDIEYFKSANSFYPLFNTNQKSEIETIDNHLNFNDIADTLMPIVIKCYLLDLEVKTDQFFWFTTNDDFYTKLPERYSWLKQEFETLKAAKRTRGDKLDVDFKIEEWNKAMHIPNGLVLNGKDKIIQLSEEELKKIGILKSKKAGWAYSIKTPYSGSSGGLTMSIVNNKPQFDPLDTIFNVDFYIKYSTDCNGDFLSIRTSMKKINDYLIDNDILLPVQLENETGNIYWFTLSENLWDLIPERYKHLKEHYNRMLYNKSLQPDRDFVKYFTEPFEKVGANVTYLELSKEELEKIGFEFEDIGSKIITVTSPEGDVEKLEYEQVGTKINCGFGKNWIQYKSVDTWRFLPSEKFDPNAPRKYMPFWESVNYISPNKRFIKKEWTEKFDSLYQSSNQGYQFVYVTDSLGRHMQKISIPQKDIQINPDDFKYLIPVMVRQSKLANEFAEDRIFWFTPTEAFFDRLPDRIKEDIRAEYNIVASDEKSAELTTCNYFESCKSTLFVENMKVYPNPTTNKITIDFNLSKSQEGSISISNIAGQQIKVLNSKTTFEKGFNSYKFDLSGISPGVYLVSIVTKEGFKTERIIVSE